MSWQEIPGWFDWSWLYDFAVERAPKNAVLVEVGVAFGRSLAYLARRAIDAKRDDLRIVGVDPWRDDWTAPYGWAEDSRPTWGSEHAAWARAQGGPFSAFVVSMREHAPQELERVEVVRGYSVDASCMIGMPWLAFLDGDHREAAVAADVEAWGECDVLAGHDYSTDFPGVIAAVDRSVGDVDVRPGGTTWIRRGDIERAAR